MRAVQNDLANADKEITVRQIYSICSQFSQQRNPCLWCPHVCFSTESEKESGDTSEDAEHTNTDKRSHQSAHLWKVCHSDTQSFHSWWEHNSCMITDEVSLPASQPGPNGAEATSSPPACRQRGHWPQHDLRHHYSRWCGQEAEAGPIQEDASGRCCVSVFQAICVGDAVSSIIK